jgi:hypothetical protein
MRPFSVFTWVLALGILLPSAVAPVHAQRPAAEITSEQVERAIRDGVQFLISQQRPDGTWPDVDRRISHGSTALVTLALLTAGEKPSSPAVDKALRFLEQFSAADLGKVYSVSLQTMVFAAADPDRFRVRLAANVAWLERAQIRPDDPSAEYPGTWAYTDLKEQSGDNSNTQYALLALHTASEVGIPVRPEVWTLARQHWENSQRLDGSWTYQPNVRDSPTASMTVAGIASLIISGLKRYEGQEVLMPDGKIRNCGKGGVNQQVQRGIDWIARNFYVGQNFPRDQTWKYYYLYGLERAGRLAGIRFFGENDWYREGAAHLVTTAQRDRLQGYWAGSSNAERDPVVATSMALLFLAKGRSPVVINKARHGPGADWNNDRDDVRNLAAVVSRDWGTLMTWQVVDPSSQSVEDLLQAPIVFINGHEAPTFTDRAKKNLREYVEQGGFILAEQCCNQEYQGFDKGFRALVQELFPAPDYDFKPLPEDHAIWRAKHKLTPEIHPLWGIEHGCRTVLVYSPVDLSCYWNQAEANPAHPGVIKALRVGQNIVQYATGGELPADKLAPREITKIPLEIPKGGALYIAKLRHAGDWNIAPLAIPNLSTILKQKFKYDVVINHRELFPRDPNLILFPLIYIHGRAAMSFAPEDLEALRRHLSPGGGIIFADAACGSPAFDAAFRKFCADLLPDHPLEPIPPDDELYHLKSGYDLADVEYTKAAGGAKGPPQLEGIKLNGQWAVIYSKLDIGCALEREQGGLDCKGYTHESAMRIAANIVIYSTLP